MTDSQFPNSAQKNTESSPTPSPFSPPNTSQVYQSATSTTPDHSANPYAAQIPDHMKPATPPAPTNPYAGQWQTQPQPQPHWQGQVPPPAPPYGQQGYGTPPGWAQPPSPYYVPPTAYGPPVVPHDGISMAALVTALVAIPVVPIVLGIIGLTRTKVGGRRGRGMAIFGLVIGLLGLLGWGQIVSDAINNSSSTYPTGGGATQSPGAAAFADFEICSISDHATEDDVPSHSSVSFGVSDAAEELNIGYNEATGYDSQEIDDGLESLISGGCDVIFAAGSTAAERIIVAAADNSEVKFVIVDTPISTDLANVTTLTFEAKEGVYLAGYVAAGMTKTGKVGVVLGWDDPQIRQYANAFANGVGKYNADKGTAVEVHGWDKTLQQGHFLAGADDTAGARIISQEMIDQGVDVLMPLAGMAGDATLNVVEGTDNAWVIWSDIWHTNDDAHSSSAVIAEVYVDAFYPIKETAAALDANHVILRPFVGTLMNDGVDIDFSYENEAAVSEELNNETWDLWDALRTGKEIMEEH